jgi:futalosine hydrolase
MKVLLVAATFPEIKPFVQHFKMNVVQNNLFFCKNNSFEISCLITEAGILATSFGLSRHLSENTYDLVVNAGVAGSYNLRMPIGTIVQVTSEILGDFGIDDRGVFKTTFEAGLESSDNFPFENGKLINSQVLKLFGNISKANGITVNTASGSHSKIEAIRRKFKPDIETMEGAAFFYTCLFHDLPFAEIRSVSYMVEPRNPENWNISLAISNLNSTLINIFAGNI